MDEKKNIATTVKLPTKRIGDSLTFDSPEIVSAFESLFYRISIKSVRATLILSIFLYILLYNAVLPTLFLAEQPNFATSFIVVLILFCACLAITFTDIYFKFPKVFNLSIAISCTTAISCVMFTVESISPSLLLITSLTMIAIFLSFGLLWWHAAIVSICYFFLNIYFVNQTSLPLHEYTLGLYLLFGFLLISLITGYMVFLLQINSFILKANANSLITELQEKEFMYRELSIKDGLTHLFNRRHFDEFGINKIKEARRLKTSLHLLLLDLDHFKEFNDTYGHPAGDDALNSIAFILRRVFRRPTDAVFRVGGEEFAVITSGDKTSRLVHYSKATHDYLVQENILHANSPIADTLTLSIGIASFNPSDIISFPDLYNRADKALYRAKQSGRNQTIVFKVDQ